MPFKL